MQNCGNSCYISSIIFAMFNKNMQVAFCSSLFELALDIEWHGAGLTTRIVLVYLGIRRAARANSDRVGQPSHQGPDASGRFAVLC